MASEDQGKTKLRSFLKLFIDDMILFQYFNIHNIAVQFCMTAGLPVTPSAFCLGSSILVSS